MGAGVMGVGAGVLGRAGCQVDSQAIDMLFFFYW
jgi:hypothetical protein